MNTQELMSAITEIGVSERVVIVNDTAEYAWCVVEAEDGAWEVFWMERGNKGDLQRFSNENQACCYLLGRLTYSQILAGLSWSDAAR